MDNALRKMRSPEETSLELAPSTGKPSDGFVTQPAIKILLVDDSPESLLAMQAALEPLGAELAAATSGQQALGLLLEHDFAAVLLDVHMPDMDGFEVAELIRQRPRSQDTPILFLSGLADEEFLRRAYRLGAVDYLQKPTKPFILQAKVAGFLGLARQMEKLRQQADKIQALNAALERRGEEQLLLHTRMLESMTEGVTISDASGFLVYANAAEEHMFGYGPGELIGQHVTVQNNYLPEENLRRVREVIGELQAKGSWTGEWHNKKKDGTSFYTHARITAVEMTSRKYWLCVQEDITERKLAEEALRRSEAELRLVLDATPALLARLDRHCRYVRVNRAYEEWFGLKAEEIRGKTVRETFGDTYYESIRPHLERVLAGESVEFESQAQRPHGEQYYLSVRYTPDLDERGEVRGFMAFVQNITDRKRMEEELRHTAQRFRLALKNSPISVFEQDRELRYTWGHNEHPTFKPEALLGKTDWELNPGPWWDTITPVKRGVLETGIGERQEFVIPVQGIPTTYDMTLEPLHDSHGNIVGISGSAVNVTARREAEARSRLLAEAGAALVSSLEYEETLRTVAKLAVPAFADWSAVDLLDTADNLQRVAVEHTDPAKVEFALELQRRYPPGKGDATREAIRTGQCYFLSDIPAALIEERAQDAEHARLVRQLGLRSFIVAPMVARGRVLGVLTFATAESGRCYGESDVVFAEDLARRAATAIENARLYAQVRESEERFRTMADSAPVLIWLSDTNKGCTWFNHPWLEFTGRTLEQEFGSGWAEGVHPEDLALCVGTYNTAFERRDPFVREYRLRRWDGEWRWVLDQGIPRSTPEGTFAGYIGSCIDITERRQTEDALRKANAELEEFAYVASHDLQEPLRMVNIYTQMILRRVLSEDEEAREYAEFIRKGVLRMQELIEDLLGYSRMIHANTLPDGTADLSESLSEALRTLTGFVDEAAITCTALPRVRGDRTQLTHVFQNLLSNSLKYRQTEVPLQICISAEREGAEWIISIQDNGIGFEQKYAEQIFGLFKRLHKDAYPGTGLGLAICQRIVERSGGRMWARSSPGQGATFFFSLPAVKGE